MCTFILNEKRHLAIEGTYIVLLFVVNAFFLKLAFAAHERSEGPLCHPETVCVASQH